MPTLKYRNVIKILRNLGFTQRTKRAGAHQTWTQKRGERTYYVTVSFHRAGQDVPKGTLSSMIRQSGYSKKEFYEALRR